jgi:hypothetical protein
MIDFHTNIVSILSSILPTHYEMSLTKDTTTPCISYMEINNYVAEYGTNLTYSRITYQIKVWSNDIAEIQHYSKEIDKALRLVGFKRISSGELYDHNSTMIQKILTYEALALEDFKEDN